MEMIDEAYPDKTIPVAWLILRPQKDGSIYREVVLSPLTDDHCMDDGDEAWPLTVMPNAALSGWPGKDKTETEK